MDFKVFDEQGLKLAKKAASEGAVLLKNKNSTLPLSKNAPVALLGRNQFDVFKGGGGAADLWAVPCISFAEGLEKKGKVYRPLLEKYRRYYFANKNNTLNKIHDQTKWQYNYTWSLPEVPLKDDELEQAAKVCETAVVFLGRFAAESFDINDVPGEYQITAAEKKMLFAAAKFFKKTVLVLNIPGTFDLGFLKKCDIDAILQMYLPGMAAGDALAEVLYGDLSPCGKLPDSWAENARLYPSYNNFGTKTVKYCEGLYMGYRYFDSFEKEVVFPFGFGLSYTDFAYDITECRVKKNVAEICVRVTNIGDFNGKETVQCYLSQPCGRLLKPYQVLCGFEKTSLLKPGESETVCIRVELSDFSSYCEERAEYILENGRYIFRVGKHSRDTKVACAVDILETVVVKKVKNRLLPREDICEIKPERQICKAFENVLVLQADFSEFKTRILCSDAEINEKCGVVDATFKDVVSKKITAEQLATLLEDDELAKMTTGDGYAKRIALGLENKELAEGEGSHTHAVPKFGIPPVCMQDGPAGVRASAFSNLVPPKEEILGTDCIAYPCATMLAATWDRKLLRKIGAQITKDMERYGYNGLCAPGVNLHRDPRCGRNFEYFSEDPYLSAEMATAEIEGIQKRSDGAPSGRFAVLKHFACNNSENERLTGDSVLSERCARELYLRVFEYVIKKANPHSIMGAYNKINGCYACANSDLLLGICREEWNYKGWIMSDWGVTPPSAECIKAGCDTVMPGEYVSFEELEKIGTKRIELEKRAANLIRILTEIKA